MAHTTDFSVADINQRAAKHDEVSQSLTTRISQVKTQAEQLVSSSGSDMTQAMMQFCENWGQSMTNLVTSHLQPMAESMRKEANNQSTGDEQHSSDVKAVSTDIGSFLS